MKYRHSLILLAVMALVTEVSGQSGDPVRGQMDYTVRGVVADSAGAPLAGATVKVFLRLDTMVIVSRSDGSFVLGDWRDTSFGVLVSLIGYQSVLRRKITCCAEPAGRGGGLGSERTEAESERKMAESEGKMAERQGKIMGKQRIVMLDTFYLNRDYKSLDTVIVTSIAPVVLKGDTVEYRAGAYSTQPGDMVEDLLKKLPGITVDNTGQITAQGKKIAKVTLNGKDFFGDDILVATQNLPPDIVKNIQVVQDYGEESKLTGIKSGQPVAVLNINTREDKSAGRFGQATAGAGTDGRYQGNVFANEFGKDMRLAVTGAANNINTGAGISDQQSFGVNYGDRWSGKLSGNGSYRYVHQSVAQASNSVQESVFPGGNTINNNGNNSDSRSTSHNLNYALEYRSDKSNIMILRFRAGLASSEVSSGNRFTINESDSMQEKTSVGSAQSDGSSRMPGLGFDLLFVHNFDKTGRVFSLNASFDNNPARLENTIVNNDSVAINDSAAVNFPVHQQISNKNLSNKSGARMTYIEPIDKRIKLVIHYNFMDSRNTTNRQTFNIDSTGSVYTLVDSLSDQYDYTQVTQSAGLGINANNKRLSYNLDLSLQPVIIKGNAVSKDPNMTYRTLNIIPSGNALYKFGKTMNMNLNYSVVTVMPNLAQLRPVTDFSNPQYPVTGNPQLKPMYSQVFNADINKIDMGTGGLWTVSIAGNATQNSIVANVFNGQIATPSTNTNIIQETRYLNVNGVYSLGGSYIYSRPFLDRKLTLSVRGRLEYNNNISFVNSLRVVNGNWLWNQGIKLALSIPGRIDLSLDGNFSSNKIVFTNSPQSNSMVNSLSLGLNARNYLGNHYLLSYNFSHAFNTGYSSAVSTSPTMINTSLTRWLFRNKMVAVKIDCYNLFNQHAGIVRVVSGNTITDSQVNQIGRYFMLSGTFRLNAFYRIRNSSNK